MDISSSETGDGSACLSLSLISYGSDVEDVDSLMHSSNRSSDTLLTLENDTEREQPIPSTLSEEDHLIMTVANQMGLSGVSQEKLMQFSSALQKMKASHRKYLQTKIVFDAVVNASKILSKLHPQTAQKVKDSLDHVSLLDYVTPPEIDLTDGIFGISEKLLTEHLPNKLSAVDMKHLQEATEVEICANHQNLMKMAERNSGFLKNVSGPYVCTPNNCVEQSSTHELLSLRKELDQEIRVNDSYLENLDTVLHTLAKLKLEGFDSANSSRVESHISRCELLKSQVQCLNDKIVSGIYQEDDHLIDAFTSLQKNLDLAVMQATSRLSMLERKNSGFEMLRGTRFDHLVVEYRELKNQIAQKEYALKNLM